MKKLKKIIFSYDFFEGITLLGNFLGFFLILSLTSIIVVGYSYNLQNKNESISMSINANQNFDYRIKGTNCTLKIINSQSFFKCRLLIFSKNKKTLTQNMLLPVGNINLNVSSFSSEKNTLEDELIWKVYPKPKSITERENTITLIQQITNYQSSIFFLNQTSISNLKNKIKKLPNKDLKHDK